MKSKKILIVYATMLDSITTGAHTYHNVISNLIKEGRVISNRLSYGAEFEDGTKVYKVRIGQKGDISNAPKNIFNKRFTHIYYDENILKYVNGDKLIDEFLTQKVVEEAEYTHIEANGSVSERIIPFNKDGLNQD